MKKLRSIQTAVLIITAMLLTLVLSVSAAADTLWISQNLESNLSVSYGEVVTLSIAATGGDGPISYQWYSNAGALSGYGTNSPSISFRVYSNDKVWCVVSSGYWTIPSNQCTITVNGGGSGSLDPSAPVLAPQIVTQPKSVSVKPGQSATLSVQATCPYQNAGVGLEYQWMCNNSADMRYAVPINGATSATYTVPASITPSKMYYICSIHSTNGVDVSQDILTDVVYVYCGEMNITKHPTGETVKPGGKATFIARADGASAFQWRIVRNDGSNGFYRADEAPSYINGLQVYGANTDTLVLSNIPASMNGMSVICVFYSDTARTQYQITNSARITVNSPSPTPTVAPYIPTSKPVVTTAPVANTTILAPTISVQPEGAVLTEEQNTSLAVVAADDNTSGTQLKYQWYKSDKNSNASGTAIAGAQSASYVPEKLPGSKYYYVGVWATDGAKTSKVVYSSPVAVTYNAAAATPSPTPTPTPARNSNDRSLLSQLALPLIAMFVAAAVGIAAFIVLKKTNSNNDDYRGKNRDIDDIDFDRDFDKDFGKDAGRVRNRNKRDYDDYDE